MIKFSIGFGVGKKELLFILYRSIKQLYFGGLFRDFEKKYVLIIKYSKYFLNNFVLKL